MGIKDDFKVYTDQYGLVQPSPGETSGNGLLYTAEYILALAAHGALDDAEKQRLMAVYRACQVLPGLMRRSPAGAPFCGDQEGPDDYVGVGAAANLIGTSLAQDVVKYGQSQGADRWSSITEDEGNQTWSKVLYWTLRVLSLGSPVRWVWNNNDPRGFSEASWLGRQQNLVCHLQVAAGENPPLWRKFWWCLTILSSMFSDPTDQDSWILSWLCVRTMGDRFWLCKWVGKLWTWKFKKAWPHGAGQLLGSYFNNEQHPLAVWLQDIF
jgi:hypothetical protein